MRKSTICIVTVAAAGMAAGLYPLTMPASNGAAPAAAAPQAVDVVHPRRQDMVHKVDTNATLEAYESADLYPKVSGYLAEVRVDIGDHVKAGQVLAVIEIPELEKELAEAKAQLEAKRADLALQQITLTRQETLYKAQGTTEQAFDEIKSKAAVAVAQRDLAAATVEKIKTMLAYTHIAAPFDGVVARRLVNRGDFVQAATGGKTTPLITVQHIDTIRVFCDVPESEISRLKTGDVATVKPFGLDGKALSGTVARTARRLDAETRNMRTEIDLPNPQEQLYPGMYAQVSLETNRHPNVLTLPASAVQSDAKGSFAFFVQDGSIDRRPIKTGMAEAGLVEVLEGVDEGAQVVTVAKSAPAQGTPVGVKTP